ncbi:MAG: hypothetical protein GC165_19010 [Armatimonadetes bacterium]|nr:hypothetical protein [Armatimonadota bacterium]
MIFMALSLAAQATLNNSADLAARIEASYFYPKTGYYKEELDKNDKAFDWTLGIILSSQNALAKLDESNVDKLKKTLEKADTYWNPTGPVGGFDVLPGPPYPNDRYYDDNAWMVMSLVESYQITHDKRWLDRAEDSLKFVLSGGDDKLGGGIYWREKEKESKNTCSNGPAAAACLAVYRETREPDLLEKAKAIYAWTKKTLRDPKDGLYFDNKRLDGKLGRTKWSYNSALMLRSARGLFEETGDPRYKTDLDALQKACIDHWVKEDGSIDDELQFSHLLFENLDPSQFDATSCITKLMSLKQDDGFYPKRWSSNTTPLAKLIIQASALRAFATYELWVKEGKVR